MSLTRVLQQILAGVAALAALIVLFFAILSWRVSTPEGHLNLGRIVELQVAGQSHE